MTNNIHPLNTDGEVWVLVTPSRTHRAKPDLEVLSSKPEFSEDILRAVVVHETKIYVANINGGDSLDITEEYWQFYASDKFPPRQS